MLGDDSHDVLRQIHKQLNGISWGIPSWLTIVQDNGQNRWKLLSNLELAGLYQIQQEKVCIGSYSQRHPVINGTLKFEENDNIALLTIFPLDTPDNIAEAPSQILRDIAVRKTNKCLEIKLLDEIPRDISPDQCFDHFRIAKKLLVCSVMRNMALCFHIHP